MDCPSTAAAQAVVTHRGCDSAGGASSLRRSPERRGPGRLDLDLLPVRGAPLTHVPMLPQSFERWAAARGMTRTRIHIGDLILELRHFVRQTGVDYRPSANRALLILPLAGAAEIVTGPTTASCPTGAPYLIAREEPATAVWAAASWGLVIHLHRNRINHAASAALGDARRLMSAAVMLAPGEGGLLLEALAAHLVTLIGGSRPQNVPAMLALESDFYRALVDRIAEQPQVNLLLSPVRSVSEAMRVVRDDHSRPYDTEALAALVGVTASTLRKGFRSTLGMSVKEYIQTVRLEWAHQTLSSRHDGRPIAAIARAAGFSESPPFSRAYMKRFGEPPSQTRARAVRAVGE